MFQTKTKSMHTVAAIIGLLVPASRAFQLGAGNDFVKLRNNLVLRRATMIETPMDEEIEAFFERKPFHMRDFISQEGGVKGNGKFQDCIDDEGNMASIMSSVRRKGNDVPPIWSRLSQKAKDDVKTWFIDRGNKKGVPFSESISLFRSHKAEIWKNFERVVNDTIIYPDYYLQPFHGYEDGNLNWIAAEDCLPATLSMSLSYWPGIKPAETQSWFRTNFTHALQDYIRENNPMMLFERDQTLNVLDVGGSVGVNAKVMLDAFPTSVVAVLDLSPHFLATARMLLESPRSPLYHAEANSRVTYCHGFAESMPFDSDSMDIVAIPFVIHELPTQIADRVIREAMRVLKPGGVLSILELDGKTVENLPVLRRFLFEVTEPHVKDYVTTTNITKMMKDAGFEIVNTEKNDPMNSRWMGIKPTF